MNHPLDLVSERARERKLQRDKETGLWENERKREIIGGTRRKGCRMFRIDRYIKAERNTGSV